MLEKIDRGEDLKKLNFKELGVLAGEIREEILRVVTKNGGHLSSNLGAVELTIALHYVFDFPRDKVVFDVGHQCYTHKILSGRREKFPSIRLPGGLSGFPKPSESEADCFATGHASTALSAALGLAEARDLAGENHEVIAVIGDGSLSGGLAYEALNCVSDLDTKVVVILNDNGMSISKTVGGLAKKLSRARVSLRYKRLKDGTKRFLEAIPLIGKPTARGVEAVKNAFSRMIVRRIAVFEQMGLKYLGPIDGNDIQDLVRFLEKIKLYDRPVLLHVRTKKGKGDERSEKEPDAFHGVAPEESAPCGEYSEVLGSTLVSLAENDGRVVGITAAMADATGLGAFRDSFSDRFFDVGIAEAHAVTFAAGLAAGGMRPYVAVYSTFLQRAYDQILHDVCLQNLPVVFCVDRAGFAPADGETHQGLFDLSYLGMIPNLRIAAPKDAEEFRKMLIWSLSCDFPLAIRYPRRSLHSFGGNAAFPDWEVLREGKGAVLLACGEPMLALAVEIARETNASVVNARFVKPLDEEILVRFSRHRIVTLEENVLSGGFGSAVAAFYRDRGLKTEVRCFGVPDAFVPHGERQNLLEEYGFSRAELLRAAGARR